VGLKAVVVLDLKMPGMDGLTVLQQIRHLIPTQPVIILTGAGTPESEQQVRELGGDRVRGKTVLAASVGGRAESSSRDADPYDGGLGMIETLAPPFASLLQYPSLSARLPCRSRFVFPVACRWLTSLVSGH